jgi:hypothetical protein
LASYAWRACAADPLSSWPALGLRGCHLPSMHMRGVEVQLYEDLRGGGRTDVIWADLPSLRGV